MASRTAGYGPEVTVSDNGTGIVRVTFPAWCFDWELFNDILTDGSHYLYNQITAQSAAITGKGGSEGVGYYFDLGGVTYPSANWNTGNRVVPTFQAAANDYTSVSGALGAAVNMDIIIVWYSTATTKNTRHRGVSITGRGVSVYGGLSRNKVMFAYNGAAFYGDLSGVTSQLVIRNLSSIGSSTDMWYYNPGGTTPGAGAKYQRIIAGGGSSFAFAVGGGATANTCQFENCVNIGWTSNGFYSAVPAKFYYCTSIWSDNGFNNNAVASTFINCLAMWNTTDYANKTNGTFTACASSDTTGSAGLQNITQDTADFWWHNDGNTFQPSARILTTSALYRVGTPVAGITVDIDGNPRHATTPSIGAHEGTTSAYTGAPTGSPGTISGTFTLSRTSGENSITIDLSGLSNTNADYYIFAARVGSAPSPQASYVVGMCPDTKTSWKLFTDEAAGWYKSNADVYIDVGVISNQTGALTWLGSPQSIRPHGYLELAD